jgi:hypothetical protein
MHETHSRDGLRGIYMANFYDHIIQDEKSLEYIRTHIQGNPIKWAEDEYFPDI